MTDSCRGELSGALDGGGPAEESGGRGALPRPTQRPAQRRIDPKEERWSPGARRRTGPAGGGEIRVMRDTLREPYADTRLIALTRLVLAASGLLTIYLIPSEPDRLDG